MSGAIKIIFFLIIAIFFGVGIFLVNWDIPAPVSKIEKVISNDRFPQ